MNHRKVLLTGLKCFYLRTVIGHKIKHDGIHAEALVGGSGAVVKQVPEVTFTTPAQDFDAVHAKGAIRFVNDAVGAQGFKETRPAAGTGKFCPGTKQRIAAGSAVIRAHARVIPIFTRKGAFGGFFSGYLVDAVGQYFLPFGVRDV